MIGKGDERMRRSGRLCPAQLCPPMPAPAPMHVATGTGARHPPPPPHPPLRALTERRHGDWHATQAHERRRKTHTTHRARQCTRRGAACTTAAPANAGADRTPSREPARDADARIDAPPPPMQAPTERCHRERRATPAHVQHSRCYAGSLFNVSFRLVGRDRLGSGRAACAV